MAKLSERLGGLQWRGVFVIFRVLDWRGDISSIAKEVCVKRFKRVFRVCSGCVDLPYFPGMTHSSHTSGIHSGKFSTSLFGPCKISGTLNLPNLKIGRFQVSSETANLAFLFRTARFFV